MHVDETQATATDPPAAQAPAPAESPAVVSPAERPEPSGLSPAACGARLAELFPALFVAPGAPGPCKPIKLRVHADILARAPGVFSKRVLGAFFSRYTTTTAYLKALAAEGAQRFDLDGQPAGAVADEHRAAAAQELARRHALAVERRAAQRHAPAPAAARATPSTSDERAPRPPRRRDHAPRDEHARRPERMPSAHRGHPLPRQPRRPAPQGAPRREPRAAPAPAAAAPAAVAGPPDPARHERALLLRAFESSPLSKANFCALKRISEAELDAQLAAARKDREGKASG